MRTDLAKCEAASEDGVRGMLSPVGAIRQAKRVLRGAWVP